jgi:hypothetical protein
MGKVRNECEDIPMVLVQNKVDLMPQAVMTKEEANAKVRQSKVSASLMHAIDPHATMCYYQLALPRGYLNCRMVAAWAFWPRERCSLGRVLALPRGPCLLQLCLL